jgi:membrane protease YdiL (CAAX protease family)
MQNHPSWSPVRIAASFILVIILSSLVIGGIGFIIATSAYDNLSEPGAMRWLQLTNSLGVFLVPPLVLMWWSKSSPQVFLGWRRARISPTEWGALLLIISGSFFTIDALAHLNMVLLPEASWVEDLKAQEATVKLALDILLRDMVPTTLLANALIMVAVPAIGEELFFRGAVQGLLGQKFNHHIAIAGSALFFALGHMQPLSVLPILFMGMIFGYLKHWTGSIWVPIGLHFINNATALGSAYLNDGNLLEESTMAGAMWSYVGPILVLVGLYTMYTQRKA